MAYLGLSPKPIVPDQPAFSTELSMTPQVKREQSPMTLYVIGAIAAYLLLMR